MKELALLNGKIVDLNQPLISMQDRAYHFGDGIYEVTSFFSGKLFMLEEHLDRLFSSAEKLKITIPYSREELRGFHKLLIDESKIQDGSIYLQLSRGVAPRKHYFPDDLEAVLTMIVRPKAEKSEYDAENGIHALLVEDVRWLRCDIKSLNLLGNVLAKEAAREAGMAEAIQHRNGLITEGSSSNFFVIKDGILYTHPANNLILSGITRLGLLNLCKENGIKVVEEAFDLEFLSQIDEAFVTATTIELVPVIAIDHKPVGQGTKGPITRKLQGLFKEKIISSLAGDQ